MPNAVPSDLMDSDRKRLVARDWRDSVSRQRLQYAGRLAQRYIIVNSCQKNGLC